VIHKAIELVKRGLELLTDFGTRAVGLEVVKQGPGANEILGRHEMTVEIAGGIQAAVERVEMAVQHVAGAIGVGVVKGQGEEVGFGTELENGLQGGAGDVVLRPDLEVGDLPHEVTGMVGVVDVPDALLNGLKGLFEMLTTRADGQESVEKARDERDGGKECFPGQLSRRPAIGIDGFRLVVRVQIQRFVLEVPIGFGQLLLVGSQRHRCTQDAVSGHRGGDVGFLTIQPGVLLVGQQVFRQFVRVFEGCAHQVVSAQMGGHALPVHIIAPKHIGQRPEGNPEPAQKERLFNIVSVADHIGHHKTGRHRVDLSPSLLVKRIQAYPAQPDIWHFHRLAHQSIQLIALFDVRREQFRILFYEAIQCFSKILLILDHPGILLTANRDANPFRLLCRFRLGFGTLALRHIG